MAVAAMDTDPDTYPDTARHARASVHPDKAAAVAEIAASFRDSSAAVLTEYRGLTVKQISELRVALGADTSYAVVKNTLTRIAAREAGIDGIEDLLTGPTAVAFIAGEPVEAAKALREFARTNPVLVVKGGVMDGQTLTPDEVRKLADLESREVLLGKMAGALLASLSNAVYLFNAPLAQAARLVGALQAKAEQDPSVLAAGDTSAAAEPDAQPTDSPDAVETGAVETGAVETGGVAAVAEPDAPEAGASEAGAVEAAQAASFAPTLPTEPVETEVAATEPDGSQTPTDSPAEPVAVAEPAGSEIPPEPVAPEGVTPAETDPA